jgi:putative ABC transport system permease protein
METLFKDIRYGFRSLLKRPGFTALAVITLALGIGANTAIFSVVNSVLLRPLPYPDSDRLVAIWSSPASARNRWTSAYADYADWKAEAHTLENLAVYNNDRTTLSRAEGPTPLFGLVTSFDLFPLLGVEPEFGRTFTAEEDRIGAAPVVVLSHDAWARRFNSDRKVIGSTTTLGDRNVTVIGVMPPGFKFPVDRAQVDYYMPLTPAAAEKVSRRSDMFRNRGAGAVRSYRHRGAPGPCLSKHKCEPHRLDKSTARRSGW